MGKKRTKRQKQRAAAKRAERQRVVRDQGTGASFKYEPSGQSVLVEKKEVIDKTFFGYDPRLIFKDLRKTALVTLIILAVLFAILFYT